MVVSTEPEPATPPVSSTEFLPGEIVEGVAIASLNAVGMQPSTLANIELGNFIQNTNQAQENEVSFQQTLDGVQATVLGKVVNMLTSLGPLASMSAQQILTGNAVAEELGALQATVQAFSSSSNITPVTIARPILPGAPGSSAARPITVGALRLNPPLGFTMNVFVASPRPGIPDPPAGAAPNYTVNRGDVYVFNGATTVDISFGPNGDGNVLGTVNVLVRPTP